MQITAIISVIIYWACAVADKSALKLGSNDAVVFIAGTVHRGLRATVTIGGCFPAPAQPYGDAIRIPENQIRAKVQVGSAVTTGLTEVLKREQLCD